MLHPLTLATHTRFAAIKHGTRLGTRSITPPIPVRLRAIVSALDSQRVFIRIRKVAVPGEKAPRAVDAERVLHVDGDEIVEARFGTGILCCGKFGRAAG